MLAEEQTGRARSSDALASTRSGGAVKLRLTLFTTDSASRYLMMIKKAVSITLLLIASACAPQAELVKTRSELSEMRTGTKAVESTVHDLQKRLAAMEKRLEAAEKRVDTAETSAKSATDVEKAVADSGARFDQLSTDIQLVQGRLEENNYRISDLAQKIDDRGFKISELAARVDDLDARMKAQTGGAVASVTSATAKEPRPAAKVEPSEAYRQAKGDYDKGNFELALAGFQNYLVQFPDASQADNAQYWIGECHYSLKEFSKAIEAFTKVISSYPKSDKVAGAKLKIGLSYLNEKNNAKAKEALHKVIVEHPGTKEADIAKSRLQKIGK
jgi:tol-pal system protein YbgF